MSLEPQLLQLQAGLRIEEACTFPAHSLHASVSPMLLSRDSLCILIFVRIREQIVLIG